MKLNIIMVLDFNWYSSNQNHRKLCKNIIYLREIIIKMSLQNYLKSRVFAIQVAAALAILGVLGFLFMHWLTYATNHGEVIVVPNLAKLNEDQVEEKLDKLNLDYVMLDTLDYNPDFPKNSVVEQDPLAGAQVKKGRKVYLKLNANSFVNVRIPNLIQNTYRQALPTLRAAGLNEGTITYVPNIGKDMVLEMKVNGKTVNAGDKVLKSTKIDLVLGDGKESYNPNESDTLQVVKKP